MNGSKARKYFSETDIEKITRAKKIENSDEDLPF
jgi:hypothetical protein